MRNTDPLDPKIAQELTELEAALADAPDADAALSQLVADVRAERPVADPAFRARLEQGVSAGFESGKPPRPRRQLPSLRLLLPVGGTALAAAVVAVAISTSNTASGPDLSPTAAKAPESTVGTAGPAGGATADEAKQQNSLVAPGLPPTEEDSAAPGEARQVERSASLTLSAPSDKIQETSDQIVRATGRLGGYVAQSSVSVQDGTGTAALRLRVPSGRLDEAMAALAKLGDVSAMNQNEQDITGTFSAAKAGLEDAKAERIGLLSALRKATADSQRTRLKQRLRENAARITAAEAALTGVRRRASLATIDVQVQATDKSSTKAREQGFGIGAAAKAAVRVLSASAGVFLLVLAAAIPLIVVTLVGVAGVRTARRRSREQALDRPPNQDER